MITRPPAPPADLTDAQMTALTRWLAHHGIDAGPPVDFQPLTGGTQNLMFRFRVGEDTLVLRRGPRHPRPRSNDALRREMRLLSALSSTSVPHARLVAACPDEEVLDGSAFYVMEHVDGFNATVELPQAPATDPVLRHGMGLSMVDAVAALGAVDHRALGLRDFGREDGFLERQVPRWRAEIDSYPTGPGYPGPCLPGLDDVARWLTERVPRAWSAGIMHGDYHLANVLFSRTDARVESVIDWEMATIGAPLLDLGWMLCMWPPNHGGATGGVVGASGGLADESELIDRYAQVSGQDLTDMTWYTVLACFKLGIILEGTNARAHAGRAPREVGDRLHDTAVRLFEQAAMRIGRS